MLKSFGLLHAKEQIRRTALEQEALAPYRPKSYETIRTEAHSTETAKDLNVLSLLNPFAANDSGCNVAGWKAIPLP